MGVPVCGCNVCTRQSDHVQLSASRALEVLPYGLRHLGSEATASACHAAGQTEGPTIRVPDDGYVGRPTQELAVTQTAARVPRARTG
jgi:hypothetical protein